MRWVTGGAGAGEAGAGRPATRRRVSWELGTHTRPMTRTDPETGRTYLWAGAKNLDHVEGMDIESSRAKVRTAIFQTPPKGQWLGDAWH